MEGKKSWSVILVQLLFKKSPVSTWFSSERPSNRPLKYSEIFIFIFSIISMFIRYWRTSKLIWKIPTKKYECERGLNMTHNYDGIFQLLFIPFKFLWLLSSVLYVSDTFAFAHPSYSQTQRRFYRWRHKCDIIWVI